MQEDQIAGPHGLDGRPDLDRPADHLVTQDRADLFRQIPRHQVAGADAGDGRADEDVARDRAGTGTGAEPPRTAPG